MKRMQYTAPDMQVSEHLAMHALCGVSAAPDGAITVSYEPATAGMKAD